MSGFARVSFVGEYYNQQIVNVMHFRSDDWGPLEGNPFDDVLGFIDAILANMKVPYLQCHDANYALRTVEAVGYDNSYNIVTASPLIRTVDQVGAISAAPTNGAAPCAIVSWRCGEQVQINNIGKSKRNHGYWAVGPLQDASIDNYGHLNYDMHGWLETLASHMGQDVSIISPECTLHPIVIHEKWLRVLGVRVLQWRTYSDIKGYRVNNVSNFRRSRMPEA
jgi:hypothetical protein